MGALILEVGGVNIALNAANGSLDLLVMGLAHMADERGIRAAIFIYWLWSGSLHASLFCYCYVNL